MKKAYSFFVLILTLLFCVVGCTELPKAVISDKIITTDDAGLIVHFIDVGQGDSTLLESKGEFALIDGGEYSESNRLISYLSSLGVDNLEFIISTHPHSDHCGGLSEVIKNFDTEALICPNAETTSSVWEYVLDSADERGVSYITPSPKDVYTVGSATITILSPAKNNIYSNLNNYSVVCKAEYGNTSFMLMGDAEELVEKELLSADFDLTADILKCGHHGSSTSTSKAFLSAVNPSAAIISCGENNDYGHPHKEVTSLLSKRNIPVFRTDTDGTIVISSDGDNLYISTKEHSTLPVSTIQKTEIFYIGNKNSKIFHESDCSSVKEMNSKNKVTFSTREEAVSSNYKPCASCNP